MSEAPVLVPIFPYPSEGGARARPSSYFRQGPEKLPVGPAFQAQEVWQGSDTAAAPELKHTVLVLRAQRSAATFVYLEVTTSL